MTRTRRSSREVGDEGAVGGGGEVEDAAKRRHFVGDLREGFVQVWFVAEVGGEPANFGL